MTVSSRISWAILFIVFALFVGWIVQPSPTFQGCIQEHKNPPSSQTLPQNSETFFRVLERGRPFITCGLELVEKHDGLVTAIFTVILTLSTVALWRATVGLFVETARLRDAADKQRTDTLRSIKATEIAANAAERSADAIQIVEGAYIYPDIISENIADSLNAFRQSSVIRTNRLRVSFRFKNFGKTPAIVESYQADLFHRDGGARLRSAGISLVRINQKTILGSGEFTEAIETEIADFSREECISLNSQKTPLHFSGEIRYADIWGNKWLFPFEWEYSGAQGRLVPDNQARTKLD